MGAGADRKTVRLAGNSVAKAGAGNPTVLLLRCKQNSRGTNFTRVSRQTVDRMTIPGLAGAGRFGGTSRKVGNLERVDRLGIEGQVERPRYAEDPQPAALRAIGCKGHEWRPCEGRGKVFGEKPAGVKAQEGIGRARV